MFFTAEALPPIMHPIAVAPPIGRRAIPAWMGFFRSTICERIGMLNTQRNWTKPVNIVELLREELATIFKIG
jgi:hypothetical protein